MLSVRMSLYIGLLADLGLMIGLSGWLGPEGWSVGLTVGVAANALLVRALARSGQRLSAADGVTLLRATLVSGVAALAATPQAPVAALVAVAALALTLDAVDGLIARRNGTVSALGARFDMEVDAFLILVLSVYDVRLLGVWILAIGAARYLFLAAGWAWPWLREATPPRYWCKVVAAIQGVALTVVAAGVLPRPTATVVALGALALLVESFGRDVWWLVRHHRASAARSAIGEVIHA